MKQQLCTKLKAIFSIFFMILIPILFFILMESFYHNVFKTMTPTVIFVNVLFFELVMILLFSLFRKANIALIIEGILLFLIGLTNYFILSFRSTPVMPWDIFSLSTAASVADNYNYSLSKNAIIICIVFILLLIISYFIKIDLKKYAFHRQLRFIGFIFSLFALIGFTNYMQHDKTVSSLKLYDKLFTPTTMTYKNGTIVTFIMQCKYLSVEKPANYSEDDVKKILANYEDIEYTSSIDTSYPNIIVIMSEAFSDLDILGEFSTNENYMPFIRSLLDGAQNTVSGYLNVSVLGGNTANTEFEFLTGNTMAFLPQGSIPYQQYIKNSIFSLPNYLKNYGYHTVAIHPYRASGWERNRVYPLLGFDSFLSINDFEDAQLIRKYVSDQACMEKIIELYEQKEENAPLFLFNVTMQNHSSYTELFDNFTPDISVNEATSTALNQFLSLQKQTDLSTEYLIDYFSKEEEPTLIVFFGDHQPTNSVVSPIYKANNKNVNDLTEEENQLRYQVPFFIWANYDIQEETNIETSVNFLSSFALSQTSVPMNSYFSYLKELSEDYPSISSIKVMDSSNTSYVSKDKFEELNTYASLQYYLLFGNH
ncbi:MAG: LTA synthase family protein [Lachnospiraceae bacterium]